MLRSLVLSGTFLFALHTSGATRFMYVASIVLIVLAVAGSVILQIGTKTGDGFGAIAGALGGARWVVHDHPPVRRRTP